MPPDVPRSSVLRALLRREWYRFARMSGQTVLPPIVTTLLFILIFGYSLGAQISALHGFSYVVYIVPGLAAQSVIINAYSNTSTSLYMARFDHTIDNWLSCPITPLQLVGALICGGVARGLIVGLLTMAVAMVLVPMPMVSIAAVVLWTALLSVLFACVGIISGLYAEGWDHLATVTNFVLTPMTYLGGVFYSIRQLPEPWATISHWNPAWYCIDGMRAVVLGQSDVPWQYTCGIVLALTLAALTVSWSLLRRGWKLVQ